MPEVCLGVHGMMSDGSVERSALLRSGSRLHFGSMNVFRCGRSVTQMDTLRQLASGAACVVVIR